MSVRSSYVVRRAARRAYCRVSSFSLHRTRFFVCERPFWSNVCRTRTIRKFILLFFQNRDRYTKVLRVLYDPFRGAVSLQWLVSFFRSFTPIFCNTKPNGLEPHQIVIFDALSFRTWGHWLAEGLRSRHRRLTNRPPPISSVITDIISSALSWSYLFGYYIAISYTTILYIFWTRKIFFTCYQLIIITIITVYLFIIYESIMMSIYILSVLLFRVIG